MAYSNWGAKVWCDGHALHHNCDVTPRMVLEGKVYTHYLMHYMHEAEGKLDTMYHAVIGDSSSGIMVCLYKSWVSHIISVVDGEVVAPEDYPPDLDTHEESGPERVHCSFTDQKGRKWKAVSGYGLGEGYEAWD